MRYLPQVAVADEVADFTPHRLALGLWLADIAEALRPAHDRLNFHPDWNACHEPPGLGHYFGHARDPVSSSSSGANIQNASCTGAAMVIPHSVAAIETNCITSPPPACAGKFINVRGLVSAVTIIGQPNGLVITSSKRACATTSPRH